MIKVRCFECGQPARFLATIDVYQAPLCQCCLNGRFELVPTPKMGERMWQVLDQLRYMQHPSRAQIARALDMGDDGEHVSRVIDRLIRDGLVANRQMIGPAELYLTVMGWSCFPVEP